MTNQDALLKLVSDNRRGVLVTLKANGRPQLSNVLYAYSDGIVRVSVTGSRAKTRNLRRDPRVSLHVTSDDFWSYTVVEGEADLSPVATDPADPIVDELVDHYRQLAGEHEDWDEYRRAQVSEGRLLVSIAIASSHAYGIASEG